MRMIIIGLAAVLLIGGGGAGAYFYFMNPAEASVGEDENVDAEKKAKKDDDKDGHDKGHVEFVELDPLILPIVDSNGVSQVVSLVIAIEAPDSSAKEEVKSMAPRLKDAFIQDMYGALSEHAALKGGVIQVSVLKERLTAVSRDVIGEDKVNDVLLQVIQQRPL